MQTEKDWEGRNEKPEGVTKETGEEERQTGKEARKGEQRTNTRANIEWTEGFPGDINEKEKDWGEKS